MWVKVRRMVYVWVNEEEEGVCVSERGGGGCMCG